MLPGPQAEIVLARLATVPSTDAAGRIRAKEASSTRFVGVGPQEIDTQVLMRFGIPKTLGFPCPGPATGLSFLKVRNQILGPA